MKKLLLEYLTSIVFSLVGFLLWVGIYNLIEKANIDISFGGDKGKIFFGIFIGVPFGSIMSILLIEKIMYKMQGINLIGIFIAILFSIICNYLGIIMLDKIGSWFIYLILPFIVLICMCGYNIGLRFYK